MKRYKELDKLVSLDLLLERLAELPHDLSDKELQDLVPILQSFELETRGEMDRFGLPLLSQKLLTSIALAEEVGVGGASIIALLLQLPVQRGAVKESRVRELFGEDVLHLVELLQKVGDLYSKSTVITSDNFSHFLLSFAEDVRIILTLIADRLVQLRLADKHLDAEGQADLSIEVSFLFAPLAHRLGLYSIKSEMEDMCLKYTDRSTYNFIKDKLAETKRSRDAYIAKFIEPVEKALKAVGLKFSIKGRTKSISSIRNKLVKQKIEFEAIYDLFAIRVILDAPLEEERSQCWKAYSIITDMFQPNPKRLKDWLSIPKSNGYESLHITVMGPEQKWVEVQIRTERMDEIAEKGLAAHWRYKGVKSETGLDDFMTSVRQAMENKSASPEELIQNFRMNLYDEEIYVFTPKGDLVKLPKGATVLDFAYAIHSGLGAKTVSAQVNGRNVSIRQPLNNGDTVSVNTSSNQTPSADWLRFVVTSKARSKIRQALRVESERAIAITKEEMHRRMRNRKLEYDEALFVRLLKKKGLKVTSEFFHEVNEGRIDLNVFLDEYKQAQEAPSQGSDEGPLSADKYIARTEAEKIVEEDDNILTIDNGISGVDYQLSKCCNPIYGDRIFAFVSRSGIKIHRMDCPNALDMFNRFGYRILKARWKGDARQGVEIVLRVVGHDNLSIVHSVVNQVATVEGVTLRDYSIKSADGLFQALLNLHLHNPSQVNTLLKTVREVSGVKSVERL